jgi:hypothetical protein
MQKKGCWFGKNCGLDGGSGEEKDEGNEHPKAPALIFMEKLNEMKPDLLITSGHGTEQSVEMPWSEETLEVNENGLVPLNENSEAVAPIIETSSNRKIFLPIANCLVGHFTGPQCGRAGWGTLDLWNSVPGRLTIADI